MFWFIAMPMMILLGRLWTVTADQGIRSGQFTISDSVVYSIFSFNLFGIMVGKVFVIGIVRGLAFNRLPIAPLCGFSLRCLLVLFCGSISASFAPRIMTIFTTTISGKSGKRLDLLTMTTMFCYDLLRHSLLLIRSKCLEPIAARTAVGSLFYNTSARNNQIKKRQFGLTTRWCSGTCTSSQGLLRDSACAEMFLNDFSKKSFPYCGLQDLYGSLGREKGVLQ